jgi:hypothetical protein
MGFRVRLAAFAVFAALLFGLASLTRAQVEVDPRMIIPSRPPRQAPPTVIAGPDVGFQMTGMRSGKPVGQLVVRVNGEWIAVEFAGGVMSLAK